LSPAGTGSELAATGAAKVTWAGAATVDASSASAVLGSGSAVITGDNLFNTGGVKLSGTAKLTTSKPTSTGSVTDPYSWYSLPSQAGPPHPLSVGGSTTSTVSPGVYSQLTFSGNANVTMSPGIYVITGAMTVSGSAHLSGSGVTIYLACNGYPSPCGGNTAASLTVSGAAVAQLQQGAVGPGDGFGLLAAPGSAPAITVAGSAALSVDGTIEAPLGALALSGTAQLSSTYGQVVLGQLSASGSAALNVQGSQVAEPADGW
jgi:hypothetical protein